MKLLLIVMMLSMSAYAVDEVTGDPTMDLIRHLTKPDEDDDEPGVCHGNQPGQNDAWCTWVCINGKWSKVCR